MRRGLVWALGATGALSAATLLLDDEPVQVVGELERTNRPSALAPASRSATAFAAPGALPGRLDPQQIELARRDIFVPVEPPAPPVQSVQPAALSAVAPAPSPPEVTWRYLGAMVTPAGERLVMLARGDSSVTVQVGTRLEEGYVVEAVGSDAVRLAYPPLGTSVDVPIPPEPPSAP
jgi:hypothetical protein